MADTVEDTTDPSEREFGPGGISLSTYRFPTGWFIVGFASDLADGQVKRAHYFGEELVIFRTESGRLNVLDAYCQHLGANMAVGGTVEGERIVCPWHGWQWNGDGTNALIPYSKIGCKQNVRIKTYPVAEWYGFIVVWHERHGRAPYWQPPVLPELETDEYYPLHPHTRMVNRVKVHAQMIIENAADPYHVQYVHKAANPANTASFEVSGYHLHATVNADFGGGRAKTWLTPNGSAHLRIAPTTSGWPIAYPTRNPARPYAFENVRSASTFGRSRYSSTPSTTSGSRTNSRYASSTTTSTLDGTASRNAISSSRRTTGPVGLFGVQTSTTFVRSVIAASIALKSWRASAVSGTWTEVAPVSWTAIGYASNERHAYTTSSPSATVACSRW